MALMKVLLSQRLVAATIRLTVPVSTAHPVALVGPVLGQYRLNLMAFRKDFNAQTQKYKPDTTQESFLLFTHHIYCAGGSIFQPLEMSSSKQFPGRTHEEETEASRVKWQVDSTIVTSAYRGALVLVILVCQVLFQEFLPCCLVGAPSLYLRELA